jgi:uncharacterized protein
MARAWAAFPGPMLLILSGEDYTAKEFLDQVQQSPMWRNALQRAQLTRQDCPEMDHTFSLPGGKPMAAGHTLAWLKTMAGRQTSGTSA